MSVRAHTVLCVPPENRRSPKPPSPSCLSPPHIIVLGVIAEEIGDCKWDAFRRACLGWFLGRDTGRRDEMAMTCRHLTETTFSLRTLQLAAGMATAWTTTSEAGNFPYTTCPAPLHENLELHLRDRVTDWGLPPYLVAIHLKYTRYGNTSIGPEISPRTEDSPGLCFPRDSNAA